VSATANARPARPHAIAMAMRRAMDRGYARPG
jgi:hypothetical protein